MTGRRLPLGDSTEARLRLIERRLDIISRTQQPHAVEHESGGDQMTIPPGGLTDGIAPSSSPTPTGIGMPGSVFLQWEKITNADPVLYTVYVIDETARADDPDWGVGASLFVGDVVESGWLIARTQDGVALVPETNYYFKIVSSDEDGSAATSTEFGPIRTDENGLITAPMLQTTLALVTVLATGTGNSIAEIQVDGINNWIKGFDQEGSETFSISGDTGNVYIKGRFDFGTSSRLLSDDIIELKEQPTGFMDPVQVQVAGNLFESSSSSVAVSWYSPTTQGNLLLCSVICARTAGVTTINTPSGWTQVATVTRGTHRISLFKIENAGSRSGSQTVTFGAACVKRSMILEEWSGVQLEDKVATNNGTSDTADSGTTATTTQAKELWFAVLGYGIDYDNFNSPSDGFEYTDFQTQQEAMITDPIRSRWGLTSYYKIATATGTAHTTRDITWDPNPQWTGIVATFKAKDGSTVSSPAADHGRLWGIDVNNKTRWVATAEDGSIAEFTAPGRSATDYVATDQLTSSATFADLATAGPSVTVDVGPSGMALVSVSCDCNNNSAAAWSIMSFAVSGATTVAASDDFASIHRSEGAVNVSHAHSYTMLVTGLTPGSNTFTAKYRTTTSTANFKRRRIVVVPL